MKSFFYLVATLISLSWVIENELQANGTGVRRTVLSEGVGKRVDIVSYWGYYPPEFTNPLRYRKLKDNFDITFFVHIFSYANKFVDNDPNLHKIVFIDILDHPVIKNLPSSKLISFVFEPDRSGNSSLICNNYNRVYTFRDDLIDNKHFFKFHYPVLQPRLESIPSFNEKNLCVMVNSRWYPDRIKILDFFSVQPKDTIHVYGSHIKEAVPQYYGHDMIKGKIPGTVSGQEKLNVLKKYRFCICFENKQSVPGYVTEKIFDVFAAGCVPIYWGPMNIESFIPGDCFINYRNFKTNDEMLDFISSMQEKEYNQYLANIKAFLESEKAQSFSIETFEELLYEAVTK